MEVLEYRRSETSSVRSELSTVSSGFAIVSAPIYKQRAPIPEYEPPPDYSPHSVRRHDSTDGQDVTQALLQRNSLFEKPQTKTHHHDSIDSEDVTQSLIHQTSLVSDKSTSQITSTTDSGGKRLYVKTDNHELTVELYEPPSPTSTAVSPTSNTGLLPRNDQFQERKPQTDTKNPCCCSKKCLCVIVAILGTALFMLVICVVLFFTVCINGKTKACS